MIIKYIFASLMIVSCIINSQAQSPQKMSYQAVIRTSDNQLVVNRPVRMRISLLPDSANASASYVETHQLTTNTLGVIQLEIGGGTVVAGSFAATPWSRGKMFIKTETDPVGGTNYALVATTQLMSVPYAMYGNDLPVSKNGDTVIIGKSRLIIPGAKLLSSTIMPASLSNGLVAYYPFNGNANDESLSGNNGVINGAVLAKDRIGLNNTAISQTTNGSYVRTQKLITNSPNTFSISFWVNPGQSDLIKMQGVTGGEGTAIMSVVHPSHGANWGSVSTNAGVGINVGDNQIQVVEHSHLYISSPLVFQTQINGWHHVVLIYNQHLPVLYLDGKKVATGLKSSMQNIHPSSGFCSVYSQSGFGNSFTPNGTPMGNFKGSYDEIRIYNRVLTEEEILYLANN